MHFLANIGSQAAAIEPEVEFLDLQSPPNLNSHFVVAAGGKRHPL